MNERIVIIGGGITAVTAIKAIREYDRSTEITLICAEEFYPYMRIKLSKGLFDELSEENMLLMKKNWYEENKVRVLLNRRAVKINTMEGEALLSDGDRISYSKLLIASGARNNKLRIDGIDEKGVYTLRDLRDLRNIKDELNSFKHVLIIGGGIQGLETAWILHKQGIKVSILELQARLMPLQLDENASDILYRSIGSFGINVYLDTKAERITGEGEGLGVITNENKQIHCDMVIYSIGIIPNLEFIEGTEIGYSKGITVNTRMETNIPNIYAAGDVAELNGMFPGLWNIAIAQGKVAGYNMINNASEYSHIVPVTTLNAFNISLFSMGIVDESMIDKVIVEHHPEKSEYRKVFIKNKRVVGAIVIGDTKRSPIFKTAIEKETDISKIDENNISIDELLDILKVNK